MAVVQFESSFGLLLLFLIVAALLASAASSDSTPPAFAVITSSSFVTTTCCYSENQRGHDNDHRARFRYLRQCRERDWQHQLLSSSRTSPAPSLPPSFSRPSTVLMALPINENVNNTGNINSVDKEQQCEQYEKSKRKKIKASPEKEEDIEEKEKKRKRKKSKKEDYQRRCDLWLDKYGSLESLRKTFGAGPVPYGDLTPQQARRLYHTLLPRSLVGLHELGVMEAAALAPLAYEARMAAKEYSRSRCLWPARLATEAFDQYRSLRDNGRLGGLPMTWEELWNKYEAQIVAEECTQALEGKKTKQTTSKEETLTMRIYLRILERSCATNQAFDDLFLKEGSNDRDIDDLDAIAEKLEHDVRSILLRPKESAKAEKHADKVTKRVGKEIKKESAKAEKSADKATKRAEKEIKKAEKEMKNKAEKERAKIEKKRQRGQPTSEEEDEDGTDTAAVVVVPPTTSQRREILLILAGTRRKFRKIRKKIQRKKTRFFE